MADTDVQITEGSGTKVDTRTVGAGTDEHRQVVVIGDPSSAAGVASVDGANGLDVDVTRVQGSVAVTGTFWQATQPVSGTVTANAGTGTMATSLAAGPPPHNVGITPLGINFAATAQQTSTNLIAGTGGQRIYVTHLTIATGGTTAGRVSIYYGTGAFTAGTSQTVFDGEFAPSSTARPGAVLQFPIPVGGASATGDNLRITTSAGITVYVTGQAYKA